MLLMTQTAGSYALAVALQGKRVFITGGAGFIATTLARTLVDSNEIVAVDKDGPESYELNKEAAVTVVVYKKGGAIVKNFAFKDSKSAAAKAKDIADAAEEALK